METIKVKLLEPIEGYEDVAEFRRPVGEGAYLQTSGKVHRGVQGVPTLVLTPKASPAEKAGLEVGAVYSVDLCPHLIFYVTADWELKEQNSCRGGSNCLGSGSLKWYSNYGYRKVINADGTMVDGDIEWVTVGGKEVTKADLREAGYHE
jgi:hypothetical protein